MKGRKEGGVGEEGKARTVKEDRVQKQWKRGNRKEGRKGATYASFSREVGEGEENVHQKVPWQLRNEKFQ